MKLSFSAGLLVLCLPHAFGLLQGGAVTTLFDLDSTCNSLNTDGTLQRWINEAYSMAQASVDSFTAAQTDTGLTGDIARAYWLGFFKVNPMTVTIPERYLNIINPVRNFLQSGAVLKGNSKPYLICDDTPFVKVSKSDQAKGKNGMGLVNEQGDPISVGSQYSQEYSTPGMRVTGYFLPAINQYFFATLPYYAPVPNKLCQYFAYGETFANVASSQQPAILLCTNNRQYNAEVTTLGSVAPNPDPSFSSFKQTLKDVQPVSSTLFHELCHFAPTPNANTGDEGYSLNKALQLTEMQAYNNAESFLYLALGAWYTANQQANGKDITYASGRCRYVQTGSNSAKM